MRLKSIATVLISIAVSGTTASCTDIDNRVLPDETSQKVERYTVDVMETHPFNQDSFTQGLEMTADGTVLVGTGLTGQSRIYESTLDGEEIRSVNMPEPEHFGEGITQHQDHVWQLTWKDGEAIKRDAENFELFEVFPFDGEGWGLCAATTEDGDRLVMSDGTSTLQLRDPLDFSLIGQTQVTLEGEPLTLLNELECVSGDVYANVWGQNQIVRIDLDTGAVNAVIDASSLDGSVSDDPDDILNGIAHIPFTDRLLLTGKRWDKMYEVRLVPDNSDILAPSGR